MKGPSHRRPGPQQNGGMTPHPAQTTPRPTPNDTQEPPFPTARSPPVRAREPSDGLPVAVGPSGPADPPRRDAGTPGSDPGPASDQGLRPLRPIGGPVTDGFDRRLRPGRRLRA